MSRDNDEAHVPLVLVARAHHAHLTGQPQPDSESLETVAMMLPARLALRESPKAIYTKKYTRQPASRVCLAGSPAESPECLVEAEPAVAAPVVLNCSACCPGSRPGSAASHVVGSRVTRAVHVQRTSRRAAAMESPLAPPLTGYHRFEHP